MNSTHPFVLFGRYWAFGNYLLNERISASTILVDVKSLHPFITKFYVTTFTTALDLNFSMATECGALSKLFIFFIPINLIFITYKNKLPVYIISYLMPSNYQRWMGKWRQEIINRKYIM